MNKKKFSPEEVWVAVLAELVQDKPVPNLPFAERFNQISEFLFLSNNVQNSQSPNAPENVFQTFPYVVVIFASHCLVKQTEPDTVKPVEALMTIQNPKKGVKKLFLHDCAETVEEEGNRDRGKNCVPEQTS